MNWLLKLFSYKRERRKNGKNRFIANIKKDVEDVRDYRVKIHLEGLNKISSLEQYLPPIRNQGAIGSCGSHAFICAYEMMLKMKGQHKITDLSELFHYYIVRDVLQQTNEDTDIDDGQSLRDGVKILKNVGVCPEELWRYDWMKYKQQPPNLAYVFAYLYKIKAYYRVYSLMELKQQIDIDKRPVVIGLTIDSEFKNNKLIKSINKNNIIGGHAMCAYKYDDEKELIHLWNSWDDGEKIITYNVLRENLIDMWSIKL